MSERKRANVLDNPAWHALNGTSAHLGRQRPGAAVFDPDVSPFAALPDVPDQQAWDDLAVLTEGDDRTVLVRSDVEVPAPWTLLRRLPCVQMVAIGDFASGGDVDAAPLATADVPDMLNLIAATNPGPFGPRTIEFGGYIGVRREGRLLAMAGQRMRAGGFTEISAVCTDPASRGQGLAGALVTVLVQQIRQRGEEAVLHTATDNVNAIRLYEKLGFQTRRTLDVLILTRSESAAS